MLPRIAFPVVTSIVLFTSSPAFAQIDPEQKTPYLWRVVIKSQHHPLLPASFREQVKRDVEAALQSSVGPLGTVHVTDLQDTRRDEWDPLWQQFEDKGFAALDAPRDLTGTKTHFLKLECRDGQYHLESRQHDGFTGLASPVIRKQTVRAPELVGRIAGLMLDRDFGLAGTVETIVGKGDQVKVIARGSQLGLVDRFVKAGDVFAVSEVRKTDRTASKIRTATGKLVDPPPGSVLPPILSGKSVPFTLLRVTDVGRDGILKCTTLTRNKVPLPARDGRATVYRCMRLGTTESPLAVRLVTSEGTTQAGSSQASVRATEVGFGAPLDPRDVLTFRDGLFRSGRPLSNVACITVSLSATQEVLIPVPVLGPDPVNLRFEFNAANEERAAFERAVLAAARDVNDARNAQTVCFERTAKLIDKQKNSEALEQAKSGRDSAKEKIQSISDELARLHEQSSKSPRGPALLKAIEQNLEALKQFNNQLETHVKTLETVVARESDRTLAPKEIRAQTLDSQIKVFMARGDVEEAINAYDEWVTLFPDNNDVKAARDKLKAEWAPKNDAHARARTYLLKTWPAVATIADFRDSVEELNKAVDVCINNNDQYTLRKLLVIFSTALVKLNDLFTALDPSAEADNKLIKEAQKAGAALAQEERKIQDFLKKK